MAVIVDLIRKRNEHHVFNSETVRALNSICKNNIYYIDDESSSMAEINKDEHINKVKVGSSKIYFWLYSSLLMIKIILIHRRNKIILLSATPLQYFICSLASKILKLKIYIFLHGELGYLTKPIGLGKKIGSSLIRSAFYLKSNVKYITIDEYIKVKVGDMFKKISFYSVDHPLQNFKSKNEFGNNYYNIGTFGIHSSNKNSNAIYDLASKIRTSSNGHIKLITIGVTDGSFKYDLSNEVTHFCRGDLSKDLIPQDVFLENVNKLDFALFLTGYDESYDLIPSGVFSDCLALEIPIITLSNPKLNFMFEKYGEIGYLCNEIDDVALVIDSLYQDPNIILRFKHNIKKIKNSRSEFAYINSLKDILNEKY